MGKLVFSFLAFAITLSAHSESASAFSVNAQATVSASGGQAIATACNYSYSSTIQCAVQVVGYYPNGTSEYAWANLPLDPGQCDYAYVNSGGYFPFVGAQGSADCSF